ncbi:MAG: hypothetical protein R2712_10010 [Vicinamibacterales bacterium]
MPEWTRLVRARLSALRLDAARESEIVEELSQHLEEEHETLRREGLGDADAQARVTNELLTPEALAAWMRPLRQSHVPPPVAAGAPRGSLWRDLAQDLRYAFGMLRRQPGSPPAPS